MTNNLTAAQRAVFAALHARGGSATVEQLAVDTGLRLTTVVRVATELAHLTTPARPARRRKARR